MAMEANESTWQILSKEFSVQIYLPSPLNLILQNIIYFTFHHLDFFSSGESNIVTIFGSPSKYWVNVFNGAFSRNNRSQERLNFSYRLKRAMVRCWPRYFSNLMPSGACQSFKLTLEHPADKTWREIHWRLPRSTEYFSKKNTKLFVKTGKHKTTFLSPRTTQIMACNKLW